MKMLHCLMLAGVGAFLFLGASASAADPTSSLSVQSTEQPADQVSSAASELTDPIDPLAGKSADPSSEAPKSTNETSSLVFTPQTMPLPTPLRSLPLRSPEVLAAPPKIQPALTRAVSPVKQSSATSVQASVTSLGTSVTSVTVPATSLGTSVASLGTSATSVKVPATRVQASATRVQASVTSLGTSATSIKGSATSLGTLATSVKASVTSLGTSATSIKGSATRMQASVPPVAKRSIAKLTNASGAIAQPKTPTAPIGLPTSPSLTKLAQATDTPTDLSPQTMPLPSSLSQPGKPATPATPAKATPTTPPTTPAKPATPLPPGDTVGDPIVPPPIAPAQAPTTTGQFAVDRLAPPPDFLNPHPNPLKFPTKPEEVKADQALPITLKQALELAERNSYSRLDQANNLTMQTARLELERSKAALREAQAALFPTVELQGSFSRAESADSEISVRSTRIERERNPFTSLFSAPIAERDDPARTRLDTSIRLNYDVFTAGRRTAQIKAAEKRVRSAELAVERTLEDLRLDVSTDYYNLQEADEQIRINQAAVRNAEISLRDTQAQERAGLGTKFDVLRSQVQLANNQQQLTNSRANQTIRRRQLAQRLSLPEFAVVVTADPVEKAGDWKWSLEQSIVQAYKNRAELEEQLVQRDISDEQRKAELAALGPTVSLQAQYNLLKVLEERVPGFSDGYSLSATARWTLFDGGQARARAQQQEIAKKVAEATFAERRGSIRFQIEQSYATLLSSQANIETTNTALDQAREALRLARLRFQAGVGTQSDVINAETDLTRAEGNRINAIIGYNRSLAQLRRFVSNISRE
jgi:outer membrane protein TolC